MNAKYVRELLFVLIVLSVNISFGQTVTGEVTSSGTPLPGASIVVKGTTNGTQTDFDGRYTLSNFADDAIMVVSYLGFITQEIPIQNREVIDIVLVEDAEALSEVVVVGYGTQRRSDLTTAISTVSSEDLTEIPSTDIGQALQGRAAGIRISNGGSPGERNAVRIRGLGTFGNGDPLYVVDGVFTSSINNINPASIKKVDVLKDAASAAIYGSRGSNGVIIITTNKGKEGKPKFNFNTYTGWQRSNKRYDLLNTAQYIQYIAEINAQGQIPNAGGTTIDIINDNPNFNGNGVETDWQEELFRSAPITSHNFNVSGGSEKATYSFGASVFDQEGVYIDTNFKRYTFNANSEFKITDKFKVGETFALGFNRRVAPQVSDGREPLLNVLASAPYTRVRNADGSFSGQTDEDNNNARNQIRVQDSDDNLSRNTSILGSLYAEYELLEGLTFRTQFGLDAFYFLQDNILRAYDEGGQFSKPNTDISKTRSNQISRIFTNSLTYNNTFADIHNINVTLVSERQDTKFEQLSASSTNDVTPLINELVGVGGTSSLTGEEILISYLGRVNYSFDSKYLLSASLRRDKSSLFGANNEVGWFPAASIGWVVSKESFLLDNPVINNLKVRASYGVTGNNNIPRDVANANVAFQLNYPIGGTTQLATALNGIANPDVKWEEGIKQNFGFDLGLLNNKVTLSADYFINKSNDLLIFEPTRPSIGGGGGNAGLPVIRNAANIEVNGLEFTLGYNDFEGDFTWGVNANVTFTDNEVKSVGINDQVLLARINPLDANVSRLAEGEQLFHFFGLVFDGVYSTEQDIIDDLGADNLDDFSGTSSAAYLVRPGDVRYRDINGDGDITADDRTVIGDPNPDFTYAINLNAGYKGFDFSALITGVQGVDAFNTNVFNLQGQEGVLNRGVEVLDRWQAPGDVTNVPRFRFGRNPNNQISTRYVEDASYARLKNVTLGYSLSNKVLDRAFNGALGKVRIYIQSQNLITLTGYSGLDPEIEPFYNGSIIEGLNIDRGRGPQPVTFLTGLQIEF